MGFFDLFKTKPQNNTKKAIANQDKLLELLTNSRNQYEKDGDIKSLLNTYEYVFFESKVNLNAQTHALYPAEQCYKIGENNLAWGYLNQLSLSNAAPLSKVRFLQAKILKKEKKYQDAIHMYMLGYLDKSKWNQSLQIDMFKKDIQSCVNKLKWENDTPDYLADFLEKQIKAGDFNENKITSMMQNFVERMNNG